VKACVVLAMIVLGAPLAAAQPRIPPNELPGRERERFFATPALERRQQPNLRVLPPSNAQPAQRRKCRVKTSRHSKRC
jgi:hypothetical protein